MIPAGILLNWLGTCTLGREVLMDLSQISSEQYWISLDGGVNSPCWNFHQHDERHYGSAFSTPVSQRHFAICFCS